MFTHLSILAMFLTPFGTDPTSARLAERCLALKDEAASRRAAVPPWRLFREFAPKFLRLAEESPSDPASLDTLISLGEYGSVCLDTCLYDGTSHAELMERTLGAIVGDYLRDERVGRLCLTLSRLPSPTRETFLRRVVKDASEDSVRGRARLALAELLKTKQGCVEGLADLPSPEIASKQEATWGVSYLAHLRSCNPKSLRSEAEALFEQVARDHGRIPFVRGTADTPVWKAIAEKDATAGKTLAMIAEADLDEIRSLAVGCVAPEIEGRDVDDVPFKLSDHRGKVIVLTFSGNWCGPCRSMYPYERELVTRLQGRPFALLSVNTDRTVETLKTSIRNGEVTWRCWWDGEPGGPIVSRWNPRSWPTIYVLDGRGVIRAKNPPDESLDRLIDDLLVERPDAARIDRKN